MSVFTSKMMAAFTPTDVFINLYDWIMKEYERKPHPSGAYDELAKMVEHASEEDILSKIMRDKKTLYLFPETHSEKDDFSLQFASNSKQILQHEFKKWFGASEVYNTLMPIKEETTQVLLKYFSYNFFVHHLSFSHRQSNCLYLAISAGKKLTEWLIKIGKQDTKAVLNLIKNKPPIPFFDSITTIIVKTSVADKEQINLFLQEHIDTIIRHEHIAWLGNIEFEDPKLQWPSNLNDLDAFNEWFKTEIYDDIVWLK